MGRPRLLLALVLLLAAGACGGAGQGNDESVVVIHITIGAGVPELRQIHVAAHLGSAGMDADLYFPEVPRPIQTGDTLALLIPTTRSGLLDLIVYGLDANNNAVARWNGQTTISVGHRVDVPITLTACSGAC